MKRRRGLSSIYGFVMIFLLSMASIQTWSYAVGSMASIQEASAQQHQLQQEQSLEHLVLTDSDGNLTISNSGQISSTVQFLRLFGPNDSETLPVDANIPIGSSITRTLPSGWSAEAVTSLGNEFTYYSSSALLDSSWSGYTARGGLSNAQLFQSSYDPSSYFLGDGASVYSFSSSGRLQWSFDAGAGYVTDILPLSNGRVFVSTGYSSTSNLGELFELDGNGTVVRTYDVRVLQTTDGATSATLPVVKGVDSTSAFFDGWFYSATGPSAYLGSGSLPIAGAEGSDFYFYDVTPFPYQAGVCGDQGSQLVVSSYTPSLVYGGSATENWETYNYFSTCNGFPAQLVGSAVSGGVVVLLMASPPYVDDSNDAYPSTPPTLVVLSTFGKTLYMGQTPDDGYSSVATNGTEMYMSLPQSSEIQVYSTATNSYTTYNIGTQASQLLFEDNHLFAISAGVVEVFDASMDLQKTIDFGPMTLASFADSFLQEPALQAPSFLAVGPSSYAALLVNATGYTSLVTGTY